MKVAGVDGAPGGWMTAIGTLDRTDRPEVRFVSSIGELIAEVGRSISHVVVDMPIGLSGDGVRPADDAARERLGVRRATFFPTPVRAVLDHQDFESANAASRRASGRGLSIQAWNLVPKIRELDACLDPAHEATVVEGHPESSFAEIAGAPVLSKKTTAEGREERLGLLRTAVTDQVDAIVADAPKRIDAIDALVLLWTARRVAQGAAIRLGDDEQRDPAGRPMWLTI